MTYDSDINNDICQQYLTMTRYDQIVSTLDNNIHSKPNQCQTEAKTLQDWDKTETKPKAGQDQTWTRSTR